MEFEQLKKIEMGQPSSQPLLNLPPPTLGTGSMTASQSDVSSLEGWDDNSTAASWDGTITTHTSDFPTSPQSPTPSAFTMESTTTAPSVVADADTNTVSSASSKKHLDDPMTMPHVRPTSPPMIQLDVETTGIPMPEVRLADHVSIPEIAEDAQEKAWQRVEESTQATASPPHAQKAEPDVQLAEPVACDDEDDDAITSVKEESVCLRDIRKRIPPISDSESSGDDCSVTDMEALFHTTVRLSGHYERAYVDSLRRTLVEQEPDLFNDWNTDEVVHRAAIAVVIKRKSLLKTLLELYHPPSELRLTNDDGEDDEEEEEREALRPVELPLPPSSNIADPVIEPVVVPPPKARVEPPKTETYERILVSTLSGEHLCVSKMNPYRIVQNCDPSINDRHAWLCTRFVGVARVVMNNLVGDMFGAAKVSSGDPNVELGIASKTPRAMDANMERMVVATLKMPPELRGKVTDSFKSAVENAASNTGFWRWAFDKLIEYKRHPGLRPEYLLYYLRYLSSTGRRWTVDANLTNALNGLTDYNELEISRIFNADPDAYKNVMPGDEYATRYLKALTSTGQQQAQQVLDLLNMTPGLYNAIVPILLEEENFVRMVTGLEGSKNLLQTYRDVEDFNDKCNKYNHKPYPFRSVIELDRAAHDADTVVAMVVDAFRQAMNLEKDRDMYYEVFERSFSNNRTRMPFMVFCELLKRPAARSVLVHVQRVCPRLAVIIEAVMNIYDSAQPPAAYMETTTRNFSDNVLHALNVIRAMAGKLWPPEATVPPLAYVLYDRRCFAFGIMEKKAGNNTSYFGFGEDSEEGDGPGFDLAGAYMTHFFPTEEKVYDELVEKHKEIDTWTSFFSSLVFRKG